MAKKGKYIALDRKVVLELAEQERVSEQTVYAALRFETNSARAVKLRAMALQPGRGGVLYEQGKNPYEFKATIKLI